ncbi:5-methyltetrahydropteroyltriglutamate--homocysteine methyltransferase [Streptomyces litmocidini]|uniref:cobalamin-independent methionine synthase II family protein n=1 Tax=Streptomyces litmocidini TaxID=67318 RepID=UPI00167DE8BD|nr:cobalamin-independent methionine synthase II family protein [Streptomyces litmocidini]GGU80123.1 5-methyltetrahydropteroyltriglutamate--homocysteine methyltransferase [Streptomyces litmocidini]
MSIPTEPIGSLPRPPALQEALVAHAEGRLSASELEKVQDQAVADTLAMLEKTGSPVLVDGDQAKPDTITYPLQGLTGLAPDGVVVPYADGHTRRLPRLTAGPFRYQVRADAHLRAARGHTDLPVKQAVVAPSALSLLYPAAGIDGYSREAFLRDLADQSEAEIRACLDAGAHRVQLDFTEGRLSLKLDPSGGVLDQFVELNNQVLERFGEKERDRLGVHTSPGADQDSTHSLDVDYAGLLPKLFQLKVGNFYLQLASEPDPGHVLRIAAQHLPAGTRLFIGVIDPLEPRVETAEEVRDRVLTAAEHVPVEQLGTCDDAGFAPYADDTSTSRDLAFAKIEARVRGTRLAAEALGL